MNELIEKVSSVKPIEHNGERVITFRMIDELHGRPAGTARKRFADHSHRMIEGEDYYRGVSEIRTPPDAIHLAQSGYLMLVKSFTDDVAWDVQRALVKCYFAARPAVDKTVELLERLTDGQLRLLGDMSDVRASVHSLDKRVQVVENHCLGQRGNFNRTTIKACNLVIKDACRGTCPMCRRPVSIDDIEYHHHLNQGGNSYKVAYPMCGEPCHRRVTDNPNLQYGDPQYIAGWDLVSSNIYRYIQIVRRNKG